MSTFFGALIGCRPAAPTAPPVDLSGTYYEIQDRVVELYYKHPRDPAEALRIMEAACSRLAEKRDLACYNLGVLQEEAGNSEQAFEAYKRAYKSRATPLYREAMANLRPNSGDYESPRLRAVTRVMEACDKKNSARALSLVKEYLSDKKANVNVFAQPYFEECLKPAPAGEAVIKAISARGRSVDYAKLYYRDQAARHPFAEVWDMERRLRYGANARTSAESDITLAWEGFKNAARAGNAKQADTELKRFLEALSKAKKSARAVRGLRRGAALLISRDSYFAGVRSIPTARELMSAEL